MFPCILDDLSVVSKEIKPQNTDDEMFQFLKRENEVLGTHVTQLSVAQEMRSVTNNPS